MGENVLDLDPQLVRLFMLNRLGNTKMLDESLKTALVYLDHNKVTAEKLVSCNDFRQILVKGLNTTSFKNSAIQVQMHGACLLQRLMERVSRSQAEILVGSGVVPLLVKLLLSQQKAICVQTLVALNSTAEHGFREELHVAEVIPALLCLTNRYPNCPVILQLITLQVSYLCLTPFELSRRMEGPMRSPFMAIHLEEQATFKSHLPSAAFMKEVIPLLARLMEVNACLNLEKIHGLTTAVASKIGIIEETLPALAESGILHSVVDLLCYPQEFVSAGAVTAIGCIARVAEGLDGRGGDAGTNNPTLEFLRCLANEGNDGLKYLHRFLKSERLEICVVTFQFIVKVVQMIEAPEKNSSPETSDVIDAIFKSGFIHVLLHSLKQEKSCIPRDFRFNVIWAVRILMRRVNSNQKQFLMESGIVNLLVNVIAEGSPSEEDANAFNCAAAVDCLLFLVTSVEKLVDCSDFLRVVVKGLQSSTKSASIHMHAASLLQHLMERATPLQAETMVGAGIIPLLVNLLPSKNKSVLVQTLMALNNISKHGFRQELHSAGLIQALIHLSTKEAGCPAIIQIIALIANNMCSLPVYKKCPKRSPFNLDDSKDMEFLKMVIPLVTKLIDINTFHNVKEIQALITSILYKIGKLGATLQWLADAGIIKKVIVRLNHPQEFVRFCAVKIIGSIARVEEGGTFGEKTLKFLQILATSGNDGLKCFHKFFKSSETEIVLIALRLLHEVIGLILRDEGWSAVTAVISSGFIHVLFECLKMDEKFVRREPEEDFRMITVSALKHIAMKASAYQTQLLVNMGIIPLLLHVIERSNESDSFICKQAVTSLVCIVNMNPDFRNKLLAHGAVPVMLKLLQRDWGNKENLELFESVLAAVEMMVTVKPQVPLENFKEVPGSLKALIDNREGKEGTNLSEETVVSVARIIAVLKNYGPSGSELLSSSGFLPWLSGSLSSNQDNVKKAALVTLFQVMGMD